MSTSDESSACHHGAQRIGEPVRAYQVLHTVRALEQLALRALSAPDLAQVIGVDPRTARDLLRRLHAEGYVACASGPRRRYRLTPRLAALGRQAIVHSILLSYATPWVAILAAQTGQPARLWIPCHHDVVCVLHAEPGGPLPQPQLGELLPAHASAPGKVLLAQNGAWRDELSAQHLHRYTDRTLTDPRELHAELERVRGSGHATDNGEYHPELRAIAAPVSLADEPIAALAIATSGASTNDVQVRRLMHIGARLSAAMTAADNDH